MSNLFPTSGQAAAQTDTPDQSGGNLFGENNASNLAAQQAMLQRMQAMQQAQLTPEQNGVFMATQAGNSLGNGLGNLINPPQPDPQQAKLAQIKQAVDAEAQSSGITDPEQYLRLAASHLVQGGEYNYAIEAKKQADALAKGGAANALTTAQAGEANSVTAKNNQGTLAAYQTQPFAAEIERQKSLGADPQSLERLANAAKTAAETGQVTPLANARIALETAQALQAKTISEKEARQGDYQLMDDLYAEKGAGTITPARQALLDTMIAIKTKPQTIVNSVMGNQVNSDTFMAPQGANPPPVPAKIAPKGTSSGLIKDAQGYINIPVGQTIPKDLAPGTKIRQGNRTGTIK